MRRTRKRPRSFNGREAGNRCNYGLKTLSIPALANRSLPQRNEFGLPENYGNLARPWDYGMTKRVT